MRTIITFAALAFTLACSNTPAGNDSGTGTVNGCSTFTDDTAAGGTVTGPSGATPAQYTPNCVHVKVGQTVTFNADFVNHPLQPFNGDTPNPIPNTATGSTVAVKFTAAGTFGFQCQAHPAIMNGAVQVTP